MYIINQFYKDLVQLITMDSLGIHVDSCLVGGLEMVPTEKYF